ncbi:hypothetical protein BDV29DRAFT_177933, partial [Aspergillus leporis]
MPKTGVISRTNTRWLCQTQLVFSGDSGTSVTVPQPEPATLLHIAILASPRDERTHNLSTQASTSL